MNFLFSKLSEFLSQYNIPFEISAIIFSVFYFFIITVFLILTVMILVLSERKLLAFFQLRKGPNRVGYWGILQTTADAIKLLLKENINLKYSDKILFTLAPLTAFASTLMMWCIIPYNAEFNIINSSVSLLLYFVFSNFQMFSHFLAGYSSNNKYSLLGSFRALSLTVSYSLPELITIMSVICIVSSMNLQTIIEYQINYWIIFLNPLGFLLFFICSVAALNRTPFDLPEAESELTCGYHTEYSGMRFALFFLGEYGSLFVTSMIISILFLGGYLPPFNIYLTNTFSGNCELSKYLIYFEQTIWLIIKSSIVIFFIIWIRATIPRITQNCMLNIFWKYLTPLSLLNLILVLYLYMKV